MTHRGGHLAQFNIGQMTYDLEDDRMAEFVRGIEMLNRIAEQSEGFVWKYETAFGGAVDENVDDDPRILVNLTVWQDVATLRHFVWKTLHKHFVTRKADWFTPLGRRHFVMWWIDKTHRPSLAEARAKLEHLRSRGNSELAFGWDWLEQKAVMA